MSLLSMKVLHFGLNPQFLATSNEAVAGGLTHEDAVLGCHLNDRDCLVEVDWE